MPTVFVVGRDWTLRATVRAELRELGVDALGYERLPEALEAARQAQFPDVVVLDTTSTEMDRAALEAFARRSQILAIVSGIEAAALPTASVSILRKPLRVGDIVLEVRHLMEGHPA